MQFELNIIKFLQQASNNFLDLLVSGITFLGEQYTFILLIALIYFVFNKKIGERLCFLIFTSACLNGVLKNFVKRPRPFVKDSDVKNLRGSTATGYSFPSGHSQNASTTYFGIALNFKKKWMFIAASVVVLFIMASRMYLGAHYLTDVLTGALLGLGVSFLATYIYEKYENNYLKKLLVIGIPCIFFLPFLFIFIEEERDLMLLNRDYYLSYAMLLGFLVATAIENKFVNFDCVKTPLKWRILRFVIGIIFILGTYFGLHLLWPNKIIVLDMLRYFLVVVIGLGLYPLAFSKTKLFR